ncbi:MAG: hypothetical protein VYB30_03430 [Candidatus Thermoplasmatota archaeon]|nr:hypothetical protein [Candidatus Thermoplasmatota archaeon]
MVFWVNQALLSFTLLLAAFSMWRMGPAFKRSKYAGPIALLGLVGLIFLPEQPLYFESDYHRCEFISFCNDDGRESYLRVVTWSLISISTAFIGCHTIIRGSRIYSERNLLVIATGWFFLGLSWWSIAQSPWFLEAYTRLDVIAWMVSFLFGIAVTVYLFFHIIRFTENITPKDPPIEPLDDKERRLVTEMIRRNLGGEN